LVVGLSNRAAERGAADRRGELASLTWALDVVRRRVPGRCLAQAVTAHFFLRRRGLDSRLCIGVVRRGPLLESHAWVELDQMVIVGRRYSMPFELIYSDPGVVA
jgi:hypothetical protein